MQHTAEIRRDIISEASRLLEAADGEHVPLRLVGGVAVRVRHGDDFPAPLERPYDDLDFATTRKGAGAVQVLLRRLGYEPHIAFNTLNSKERLLFFDEQHGRHVDVFVGTFRMSHKIPLEVRLEVDRLSVPLAELLLTKLQIVELNEKDVRDAVTLLAGHDIGATDGDTLNGPRVADLCAADWGLWRTITKNLDTVAGHLQRYEIDRETVARRLEDVQRRIDDAPKSRSWRLRAKIGERKRWYQLPMEVGGRPVESAPKA